MSSSPPDAFTLRNLMDADAPAAADVKNAYDAAFGTGAVARPETGSPSATLGVDAGNTTGATRLYDRVGMHVAFHANVFRKQVG